ncbi:set5 [Symbiodinium sp. KB8]|nr:set5 [Symbiodinium sp. KB8]
MLERLQTHQKSLLPVETSAGRFLAVRAPDSFYNYQDLDRKADNYELAVLLTSAVPLADHYMQVEADVLMKKGFMKTLQSYVASKEQQKEPWHMISLSQDGHRRKIWRSTSLFAFAGILTIFPDVPPDSLVWDFLDTINNQSAPKACVIASLATKVKRADVLLQYHKAEALIEHVGDVSSLEGKVQRIHDDYFKKHSLISSLFDNPAADIYTADAMGASSQLQATYGSSGISTGQPNVKVGTLTVKYLDDMVGHGQAVLELVFKSPTTVQMINLRLGGCKLLQFSNDGSAMRSELPSQELDSERQLEGCVVELQDLSRAELNGQRGLCLGAPPATPDRIGVRLDDGREVSVPRAKARAIIGFREVDGKGIGVIALSAIPAGGLLLRERPALCIGSKAPRPPAALRKAILELCDAYADRPDEKTLDGVLATNALPRGAKSEETVLCLLASRFNHSCSPNAEYLWVEESQVEEVRAVRAVQPGEELCVNYFGDAVKLPRPARQEQLRAGFRFECRCSVCVAASPESDRQRQRLTRLSQEILSCRNAPERGLRMAEEMLEIMGKEGISAPRSVAQVCNDGFELALLAGEGQEVQYWAHLSYEAHRLGWGEDYEMTRRMRHYAQHPPTLTGREGPHQSARGTSRPLPGEENRSPNMKAVNLLEKAGPSARTSSMDSMD